MIQLPFIPAEPDPYMLSDQRNMALVKLGHLKYVVDQINTQGFSGPTLQTNSVTNGSQSLLNLLQGTGISLSDDGNGNITITNTGSSGGTIYPANQIVFGNGSTVGGVTSINLTNDPIEGFHVGITANSEGHYYFPAGSQGSVMNDGTIPLYGLITDFSRRLIPWDLMYLGHLTNNAEPYNGCYLAAISNSVNAFNAHIHGDDSIQLTSKTTGNIKIGSDLHLGGAYPRPLSTQIYSEANVIDGFAYNTFRVDTSIISMDANGVGFIGGSTYMSLSSVGLIIDNLTGFSGTFNGTDLLTKTVTVTKGIITSVA